MQNKLNAKLGSKKQNSISVNNNRLQESKNGEFSDWPHGLLAIGTFGNKEINKDCKSDITTNYVQENYISLDHMQELTLEQVEKLEKELNLLLHKQVGSAPDDTESDTANSKLAFDDKINENYDEGSSVIIGRGKGTCVDSTGSAINKKSFSFLLKKMLGCRGGFTPTLNLKDQVPESRMEKILRAIIHKKIYPQNPSSSLFTKKYLGNKKNKSSRSAIAREEDEINQKDDKGSKWVKTDSEYIVLEI
ncbi:protein NEGATIVE GRAVITROPIC RESPONSE OF ROOTS isoform X2 [Jatropha curcas]|nr:protein NEGATIVE GRAVITROPIC RESPONSE OF ROOTS isoform X2 [Jatropha curcas]